MTDRSISIDTGTDELQCTIRDRVAVITLLDHEAEQMVVAAGTAQHAEAVRAFIEKRAPSYR